MKTHIQNTELKIYPFTSFLIAVFLTFCPLANLLSAQSLEPESLLRQSDSLFNQKSYQEAALSYNKLIDAGYFSPSALLRYAWINEISGQPEEAVFALYKYYLITDDQDAYAKILELTDKYHISGYQTSESEYLLDLLLSFQWPVSIILLIVTLLLLGLSAYRYAYFKAFPASSFQYLNLLFLTLLFISVNLPGKPEKAIIGDQNAILLKGPSPASGVLSTLSRGDLVKIIDTEDVWTLISIGNKQGWVKAKILRQV